MAKETPRDPASRFNDLAQIGVAVRDVEKSARRLSQVFGIGPFRFIDYPPPGREDVERVYHGAPADFTARLAFANLGPVELELIQPLDGQSVWRDFLEEHGEGIHHIRFNVADIEETTEYLAGQGIPATQWGSALRPGTIFRYFGTEDKVGFVIEVLNKLPGTDGRTPVGPDGRVQV